jgi:quercetin dioxygenase-like cupin family protein
MRHRFSRADEPHFLVRSLAIDYGAGGQEDMHAHPWPQFLYAQSGALRASIEGRFWTLPTRRGLWIPAHTPHRLSMSSRLQLRTLYLPPPDETAPQGVCVVPVSGLLHETISRVCAQGVLDRRIEFDLCLATIIRAEITFRDAAGFILLQPKDTRARKLADFFFDATCVGVPLDALCERAGLSRRSGADSPDYLRASSALRAVQQSIRLRSLLDIKVGALSARPSRKHLDFRRAKRKGRLFSALAL